MRERALGISHSVVAAGHGLSHAAHRRSGFTPRAETAAVAVVVMVGIAVVPIVIIRPDAMCIPPRGIVAPIPRRGVSVPIGTPEPVVDDGLVDIHGLDDIVGAVDILIPDDLDGNLVRLVLLNIYRCHILVDVFRQDSLQDDKAFLAFSHFHHADIVNLAVAVQVEVAERRVGVVEQGLKLLKVFGLCKKFRYYLQVKPL